MPNTGRVVILQKKEGCMNMYGHILYIIIYWCYVLWLLCFFFRFLFLEI